MLGFRASSREVAPLLLAVLALYWQPVFAQGVFFQRDIYLYWLPQIEWAARVLSTGRLPQWDPFIGFGQPFLADPNLQPMYPFTWLNMVLQPTTVYSLLVVTHAVLGAVGMFVLLRRRLRSREAAWVGGIVFVAGGAVVSSANLWHHYSSVMYMPWVADAFLRVARRARGGWVRLAVSVSLQALAGSADVVLMTAFGMLCVAPFKPQRLVRLAPRLIAAVILCCALAAVQWLPTTLSVTGTMRTSLPSYDRLYWSVPPIALMDFVLPLSGVAHARTDEPGDLEHRFRLITSMYLGASTIPLLVLGARRWPRGLLLLVTSLALAMGRHGPLGWASELPLISMVRFPSKTLWLFSFFWAVLTAVGIAVLARLRARLQRASAALGVALWGAAAMLSVAGISAATDTPDWRDILSVAPWAPLLLGSSLIAASLGRGAVIATASVIAIDVVGSGQMANAYSSGEMFRLRPGVVDALRGLNADRVFVLPDSRRQARSRRVPPDWSDEEGYYFAQGQMLVPPQGVRWGLRGSFDGDFSGLAPRNYTLMSKAVTDAPQVNQRWLQLGGVTHVLRFASRGDQGMDVVAQVRTFHDETLNVLRVPDPRPRAYFASRVRSADSAQHALQLMLSPDFDVANDVVRLGESGSSRQNPVPVKAATSLFFEDQKDGKMTIRASLDAPRTLVVLEAFSAGWFARVNGRPAVLRPANLIFQSVDLDAGEHRIELEYQTPGLAVGFSISAVAWLGLLVAASRRTRAGH